MSKIKTASVEIGDRIRTINYIFVDDVKNTSSIIKNPSFSDDLRKISLAFLHLSPQPPTNSKAVIKNVRSILDTNERKQMFIKILKLINGETPTGSYSLNDNIVNLEEYCMDEITTKPKKKTKYLEGREDFASEIMEFVEEAKEKSKNK